MGDDQCGDVWQYILPEEFHIVAAIGLDRRIESQSAMNEIGYRLDLKAGDTDVALAFDADLVLPFSQVAHRFIARAASADVNDDGVTSRRLPGKRGVLC